MAPRRSIARRQAIVAAGALLAGCLGTDDPDDGSHRPRQTGPMVGETELAPDFPITLVDVETEEIGAEVHWHGEGRGEWHYQPLEIPLEGSRAFAITVEDVNYEELDITDGTYEVVSVPPDEESPIIDATMEGDRLTVRGTAAGRTDFWLEVRGPDGGTWTSPGLRTRVGSG